MIKLAVSEHICLYRTMRCPPAGKRVLKRGVQCRKNGSRVPKKFTSESHFSAVFSGILVLVLFIGGICFPLLCKVVSERRGGIKKVEHVIRKVGYMSSEKSVTCSIILLAFSGTVDQRRVSAIGMLCRFASQKKHEINYVRDAIWHMDSLSRKDVL